MPTTNIDPTQPNFEQLVEQRLYQFAEEYSVEKYPAEHRSHLGASSIGEECWRKLWYQFRWVKLQQAEGRMRRLWNRGHREEEIFESFLLWAGFSISSINPETDKQYVFSKINGHYGGSTDGKMEIRWAHNIPLVTDYKTFAFDYFQKLKKERLKISNLKYYAQLCSYGREFGAEYGLLFAVNKDNDDWYFEFLKLDHNYAIELEKKAADIIHAINPPAKINNNPAFYKCKMCTTFQGICHFSEPIEKNCRSCKNSSPIENAQWKCSKFGVIPKEAIKDGCPQWEGIV